MQIVLHHNQIRISSIYMYITTMHKSRKPYTTSKNYESGRTKERTGTEYQTQTDNSFFFVFKDKKI